MKKLQGFAIFLTMIISGLSLLSGCKVKEKIYYESDDFIYYIDSEDEIVLTGLSESGKGKEEIVVPELIDGKTVYLLLRVYWGTSDRLVSENLKTLYIEGDTLCGGNNVSIPRDCPNLKKVVFLKAGLEDEVIRRYLSKIPGQTAMFYVCSSMHLISYHDSNTFHANTSYLYNYEGAENEGYYWIDNFDYGGKIEYIPENPEREGYVFGGWYKDAECQNIWNFEQDTLPEAKYNEEGEELYQETRLYAKWHKN